MNKNFVCLVGLAFLSILNANAAILNAPFIPEADKRFDIIENPNSSQVLGSQVGEKGHTGSFVQHEAKAIVTASASGAVTSTGIVLPANSIITQAYWYASASGTPPSGTTLMFQCDSAGDIYPATDISAIATNAITAGVETGTAATMHYSSAGCTVKYQLGVHNPASASTWNLFLDYVVAK